MENLTPPAVAWLASRAIYPRLLEYEYASGAISAALSLDVPEHSVVKTLVFADEHGSPVIALMHADLRVSVRKLERISGSRRLFPASPEFVQEVTGYMPGGVSPFGLKRPLPLFIQSSLQSLNLLFVNAGKRGWVVEIGPEVLGVLDASWGDFASSVPLHRR